MIEACSCWNTGALSINDQCKGLLVYSEINVLEENLEGVDFGLQCATSRLCRMSAAGGCGDRSGDSQIPSKNPVFDGEGLDKNGIFFVICEHLRRTAVGLPDSWAFMLSRTQLML